MFDADQIIYEAAAEQLSHCDLPRRRKILQALLTKITVNHPAWKNVSAQLGILDSLEHLQSQLPLKFNH